MTKFQPLQKIHKLFLGNQVAKFVEITLYLVNPVSSLSRFYVYIRLKFKTVRVRRGFIEILVQQTFRKNNSYKIVMIIVSYQ